MKWVAVKGQQFGSDLSRSTDFEVHRNWLAITHSLPINQWYHESTSEWTLDYPPLFAWFEYILSLVAKYFDERMLDVNRLNYGSLRTVFFQRFSVIVTDILFAYAAKRCCSSLEMLETRSQQKTKTMKLQPLDHIKLRMEIVFVLLVCNIGLTIVDHIHFQYNGFLFGILLLSVANVMQDNLVWAAFWFGVLLNLKHIFLYMAPAYGLFYLKTVCFKPRPSGGIVSLSSFSVTRTLQVAAVLCSVFAISFGPFVAMGQIKQVLGRLFPFKRGLCHAYWAPNVWVFYNLADKALVFTGRRFNLISSSQLETASMTGGLVREFDHMVLPKITPLITVILTAISILPHLWKLWRLPANSFNFIQCLVLCSYSSFLFGWHVHEKAILMVIIPLTLVAATDPQLGKIYTLITTVGHFSLFPLLFTSFEAPIKLLLFLAFSLYSWTRLQGLNDDVASWKRSESMSFSLLEKIYLVLIVPVFIFNGFLHEYLGLDAVLPFLPLLSMSFYCALGIFYGYLRLSQKFLCQKA